MISFFKPTKCIWWTIGWFAAFLAGLYIAAIFLSNDIFGPFVAALIYGPLFLLDLFGIPLTSLGDGGWGSPNIFGWILLIFFYFILAYVVGSIISRIKNASLKI